MIKCLIHNHESVTYDKCFNYGYNLFYCYFLFVPFDDDDDIKQEHHNFQALHVSSVSDTKHAELFLIDKCG